MPRQIVLGNGRLLVNVDEFLQVRDIFYPHVGQENHLMGHTQKIGVYADGKFSWIDNSWTRHIGYRKDTAVVDAVVRSDTLDVELEINGAVDCEQNIFIRKLVVKNLTNYEREIRVFFYHDFHLYGTDVGDTAAYEPKRNAIFHYKRNRYFLINAVNENGNSKQGDITHFAVGEKETKNSEGTYRDAEDGNLSGNPIAQGSVDSTICLELNIPANNEKTFYYWICAGKTLDEVKAINDSIDNPAKLLERTKLCWRGEVEGIKIENVSPEVEAEVKRSLLIINTQIDEDGAIIAANDSTNLKFNRDTYSYMWPRDGAITSMALNRLGRFDSTRKFLTFCAKVISKKGCLLHKYNPDGSLGSSWHPWIRNGKASLPIQEDSTALVVSAIKDYLDRSGDLKFVENLKDKLLVPTLEFMINYFDYERGIPLPSHDLWEERYGVTAYTCAAVWKGLQDGAKICEAVNKESLAKRARDVAKKLKNSFSSHFWDDGAKRFIRLVLYEDGHITKDPTMDAGLCALFDFGMFDANDEKIVNTMNSMRETLWCKTDLGGLARNSNDYYHKVSQDMPGNPWPIATAWLGKWYVRRAKTLDGLTNAENILNWLVNVGGATGVLPEQVNPYTGEHISVSPLTWSHAEFVNLALDYSKKYEELTKK